MELEKKALIEPDKLYEIPMIKQNVIVKYFTSFCEGSVRMDLYLRMDHYFKHPSIELPLVRVREESCSSLKDGTHHSSQKTYLTIKNKVIKDGFEVNEEIEDETNQVFEGSALKKLFESLGMNEYFTKEKVATGTHVTVDGYDLHVEFVTVCSTGSKVINAIEVECIVPEATPGVEKSVGEAIDKFFDSVSTEHYNLRDHIDGRSWKDLLSS